MDAGEKKKNRVAERLTLEIINVEGRQFPIEHYSAGTIYYIILNVN